MKKVDFENSLKEFIRNSPENCVQKDIAIRPDLEGMCFFDEPLFGYASAEDPYFKEAKEPGVIGPHFITPCEWLPGAKTVFCAFLPFSSRIRSANSLNMDWPADEWLHARIEGQAFQGKICRFAEELLIKEGFAVITPSLDSRFSGSNPVIKDKARQEYYTSNWSERHAAYAAGLGTFGLSKGLITRKGVAGRFLSIISNIPFEPDKRPYTGIYDYCSLCGACARNCPVKAISKEEGKLHPPCSGFLDTTKEKHSPRYGCGKCQVKVPCESKAPKI